MLLHLLVGAFPLTASRGRLPSTHGLLLSLHSDRVLAAAEAGLFFLDMESHPVCVCVFPASRSVCDVVEELMSGAAVELIRGRRRGSPAPGSQRSSPGRRLARPLGRRGPSSAHITLKARARGGGGYTPSYAGRPAHFTPACSAAAGSCSALQRNIRRNIYESGNYF
ncbi:hypothetical protein EYF80_004993 [Liparis tanakae]|uniref:Uncharacterized protein n=1 Tax=Liparis tanakae TaxID=230148 RepID=A0A4Z2J5L5_9TELE|nr:hypothetical protein EYF80_004993 [Liparis tanakae]